MAWIDACDCGSASTTIFLSRSSTAHNYGGSRLGFIVVVEVWPRAHSFRASLLLGKDHGVRLVVDEYIAGALPLNSVAESTTEAIPAALAHQSAQKSTQVAATRFYTPQRPAGDERHQRDPRAWILAFANGTRAGRRSYSWGPRARETATRLVRLMTWSRSSLRGNGSVHRW